MEIALIKFCYKTSTAKCRLTDLNIGRRPWFVKRKYVKAWETDSDDQMLFSLFISVVLTLV